MLLTLAAAPARGVSARYANGMGKRVSGGGAEFFVATSETGHVAGSEEFLVLLETTESGDVVDQATQDMYTVRDDDDDDSEEADKDSSVPLTLKATATFKPCDPDDFDPGEFGGRESTAINDIPDPGW